MNRVKCFVLVLLVLACSLGVASLALAKPVAGLSWELKPPAVDPPEPQASGRVSMSFSSARLNRATVGVACTKLTPRARYTVVCWNCDSNGEYCTDQSVTADRNGDLGVRFGISWDANSAVFVWVQNEEGAFVLQ
jgi:hypothetical protein